MSFFDTLFRKEKYAESVVLVDIGASTVAGAYAHYAEEELPVLLYTRRLPIKTREGEPQGQAMVRALTQLSDTLIREGAPILARAAGRGNANTILISIDAPWQKTSVRTEHFERKTPFIFTKSMVVRALEQTRMAEEKQVIADESIIGTILNGYETRMPYGQKVHRASVVVLTSFIDTSIARSITSILRSAYHTKHILSIANSSLRYQALCYAFPHEHDMLILDAFGPTTSISLVRHDLFVDMVEVPFTTDSSDSSQWIQEVINKFSELAEKYPLPRTIFLLAQESEAASLQKELAAANLGSLWLSDNPPTIVAILASHLNDLIKQAASTPPDLPLLLMTLYYQHHTSG